MTDWAAGMRCVCVREYPSVPLIPDLRLARKGRVYTVRAVVSGDAGLGPCLYLCEISNAHLVGRVVQYWGERLGLWAEPAFEASFFRPLVETRLDQFRQHLAPAPRETEDA